MLRIIILLICSLFILAGYNTVKGFGKDIQAGDKKLEQL
ncbi:MAG: entericidin EcnA/B family protein [Candidatus Rickettsia vulgarisii]